MDNTVALLTGINVNVKAILDSMNMAKSRSANEQAARTVSSLSTAGPKEGINLADTKKSESGSIDMKNVKGKETSIADLVKLLNDIPSAVKGVAGIKNSDIKKFDKNIDTIIKSLDSITERYSDGNPKMIKSMAELFKSLNGLTDFVKSCAKISGVILPAKLGLKLMTGFFDGFAKLIDKISKVKNVGRASKAIQQMGKLIDTVVKMVGKTALAVGIMALTGVLISKAFPMILLGFVGIGATMVGIMIMAKLTGKIASKAMKFQLDIMEVIKLYMMSASIIVVSTLIGVLVTAAWKTILLGFASMSAMLFGIIGVGILIGVVAKTLPVFSVDIKSVVMMYMMAAGLIIISALTGWFAINHYGKIMAGFTAMNAILYATLKMTKWIARAAHDKDMKTAVKNILLIEGALGASAIIILAAVGVSKVIEAAYGDPLIATAAILGTFTLMSGIVLAAAGLAKLASKFSGDVKKGAVALLLMEGVLLAANVVILAMLGTSKAAEGHWDQIWLTFASMTGMVTAIGLLAAGAGAIAGYIMPGVGALALVELLIGGMMLVTVGLIKLHQYKETMGVGWNDMFLDITAMGGMAGEFAVLAGLLGLAVIPVTIGLASAALLARFVTKLETVVMASGHMHEVIMKNGGADKLSKTITTDLPKILKSFNNNNLSFGFKDLIQIGKLSVMCTAVSYLAGKMLLTATALAKIAQIGGMISPDGGIRPIVGRDSKGKITYGEPVDLKFVATTIGGSIRAFVDQCNYGLEDVLKMMSTAAVFEMIGKIIDPVDKFVKMITGYTSAGEGMLSPMYIDKEGRLVASGAVCDVASVSKSIVSAITTFVGTLYDEANIKKWIEYSQGKRDGSFLESIRTAFGGDSDATRAIKDMGSMLGTIIAPVSDFVKLLSGFGTSADGKLHTVSLDSEGKVLCGPDIDIPAISTAIVGGISTFVDAIYAKDKIDTWMKMSSDADMEKLMNPIKSMMETIAQFSDTKKYDAKKIDTVNTSITKLLASFNKSVLDVKVPKIQNLSISIGNLTLSLGKFDKVLKKDADNRKKRLEELNKTFQEMSESLKGASASMGGFTEAIGQIQNMDTGRMKEKLNAVAAGISSVSKASQGMQSGTVNSKTENILQSAMLEAMRQALTEVFDGATLQQESKSMGKIRYALDVNGGDFSNS